MKWPYEAREQTLMPRRTRETDRAPDRASYMTGTNVITVTQEPNPAALSDYDPQWPRRAARLLADIRESLSDVPEAAGALYDHIGSTSVPGLAAKPFIDLQVRMLPLACDSVLIERLRPLGYRRARGSRPDSPGVDRDIPRGFRVVQQEVWVKSLFTHDDGVIVHIRRSDSPWADYTVWFRDWLRAHPLERGRYETLKRRLSARNVGKPDYDDYTRAKTAFFNEGQQRFESWASSSESCRD